MERRLVNKIILFFMLFFLGSASVLFAWNVKNSDSSSNGIIPRASRELKNPAIKEANSGSSLIMPQISAPAKSHTNENIVFRFADNGTFLKNVHEIWAKVSLDGSSTKYWKIILEACNVDGKSLQFQVGDEFKGKNLQIEFIFLDNNNKYTVPSNKMSILIDNN